METKQFYCEKCKKQYKSYNSLWNHNKKFHPNNIKVKEYICKTCKKIFDNKQNKYYHQKSCTNTVVSTITPNVKDVTDAKAAKITTINNTNNTNSMNNITNSNNKTIIINNYGNDNLDYITDAFKAKLFKHLLDEEEHIKPLPHLLENIKFNSNHKENHNVKIKSDRSKIGFYYDQNKWKAINKNDLLDDLCNYSLKIFAKYFKEKKEELSEDTISQYNGFYHSAKLKSELREQIENVAYIFTINNDENELDV